MPQHLVKELKIKHLRWFSEEPNEVRDYEARLSFFDGAQDIPLSLSADDVAAVVRILMHPLRCSLRDIADTADSIAKTANHIQ